MVTAADAVEEREVLSGNGVAEHEGGNAGRISPEGEGNQVQHEACMLGVVDSLDRA